MTFINSYDQDTRRGPSRTCPQLTPVLWGLGGAKVQKQVIPLPLTGHQGLTSGTNRVTLGTTVHSEKDERWLRRAPVFDDFVAHCAMPRDSKLEKGSKKGTSTGVRTANVLFCKRSERPGFSWFFPNSNFWGQNLAESYSCYGLLFGEIDFKNTIGRAFHGGLLKKTATKTQNLTRSWPKARISSFSKWTVVSIFQHRWSTAA